MKTTIDNTYRVFFIYRSGWINRKYFCNLKDIPKCLADLEEENDQYTISECWNGKFKRVSKKHLNEMFESNRMKFRIK